MQSCDQETALSSLAVEFLKKSLKKQCYSLVKGIGTVFFILLLPVLYNLHNQTLEKADNILNESKDSCQPNRNIANLLRYIKMISFVDENFRDRRDSNLCKEVIRNINLSRFDFSYSSFQQANLQKIKFRRSTLQSAKFQGATLLDTDFYDANLTCANFECLDNDCSNENITKLEKVNFRGAELINAKLKNALLLDIQFDENTELYGADLSGAKRLDSEQLKKAKFCQTTLPQSFKIDANEHCTPDVKKLIEINACVKN